MEESQGNQIETWAVVEIFGHQKMAGFVRTAVLGSACMLRVDVPDMPEEEVEDRSFDFTAGEYVTTKVKVAAVKGFTRYLGISSIFSLTPCTEEFARAAQRRMRIEPPRIVEMPQRPLLPPPDAEPGMVQYVQDDE